MPYVAAVLDVWHILMSPSCPGLGELVFVVRKHKILTPPMDVYDMPQYLADHGAALDMPPRATWAPR